MAKRMAGTGKAILAKRMAGTGKDEKNMVLVIGGYAQGKLEYAREQLNGAGLPVLLGERMEECPGQEPVILLHLQLWVRELLQRGEDAQEMVLQFVREHPGCILICDEIGNGIVPMEAFERAYREQTGRLLICLAKEAERVDRVICGIGQRLK